MIDISVQTEPLVNDFAVQVDFEFPEKVQAQVQTEHAYECHGCTQLTPENDKLLKSTAIQFYTGLPNYVRIHIERVISQLNFFFFLIT